MAAIGSRAVTVLRANNLPLLKHKWGKERRFYATITDGTRTKKSKSIHSLKHQFRKDTFIGSLDIKAESRTEASFPIACEAAPNLAVVLTVDTSQLVQATKHAICDANQALSGMHILEEWKGTVKNIQWVMDIVSDVAGMNPYAQMAWHALSSVPKLLLAQLEHDENVQALVDAMRSTFDLAQAEDLLKAIKPNSNQALVLKVMLRHIKICSEVIKRSAEDKEF
ncbi:hypothetical protein CVT25_001421, partial [Psilocybe cyanescens]